MGLEFTTLGDQESRAPLSQATLLNIKLLGIFILPLCAHAHIHICMCMYVYYTKTRLRFLHIYIICVYLVMMGFSFVPLCRFYKFCNESVFHSYYIYSLLKKQSYLFYSGLQKEMGPSSSSTVSEICLLYGWRMNLNIIFMIRNWASETGWIYKFHGWSTRNLSTVNNDQTGHVGKAGSLRPPESYP